MRALCRALGVSVSGFYRWLQDPVGRLHRRRQTLATRIRAVHHRSRGAYGSPRVQRPWRRSRATAGRPAATPSRP